jgi:MFS family permease
VARLGKDFGRLWAAYAISAAGSTVSAGALGLVAVLVLDAPAWQVSMITAISAAASAVLAFPLGPRVEFNRKRPAMIISDLARCVALASVPVAAALHILTMMQLYVVDVVVATAFVVFAAAGGAHLKALVAPEHRAIAMSRFESTDWVCWSVGPPIGGLLISGVGATVTMLVDAVSFLLSALGVRRLRTPEPPPPVRTEGQRREDLTAGWRYLLRHPDLRPLFANAVLFSGAVLWVSPLETVYMLRNLGFRPWEYGLVLGLPCLGGLLGARLAPRLSARFGARRVLRWTGVARTPWLLALPFATPGTPGVVVFLAANFGLLLVAGVFNPTYATHRLTVTRDDVLARVVAAWSTGTRSVKPLFIMVGGVVAAVAGVRAALGVGGALCLISAVVLPHAHEPVLEKAKSLAG